MVLLNHVNVIDINNFTDDNEVQSIEWTKSPGYTSSQQSPQDTRVCKRGKDIEQVFGFKRATGLDLRLLCQMLGRL